MLYNIPENVKEFLKVWNDKSKIIELKTSGSTGNPKKIIAEKEHLKKSAFFTGKFLNLQNNSALCCLPIDFIAGKMMIIRALELNMDLYFTNPSLNPLENINDQFDFCAMIPMQVENSLTKITNIKKIIIGGSSVNYNILSSVRNLENQVYETFGMTETFSHFALKKISQNNQENIFEVFEDFSVYSDENNKLIVKTPYFKDDLKTNDVVEIINKNKFIWKGRADFIINSGGIKLNPEEIEKKIEKFINKPFIISSLPNEKTQNKVILIIENNNKENINVLNIKENIKNVLNKYEVPKEVFFIDRFARTFNNKIIRNKLPKLNHII